MGREIEAILIISIILGAATHLLTADKHLLAASSLEAERIRLFYIWMAISVSVGFTFLATLMISIIKFRERNSPLGQRHASDKALAEKGEKVK